MNDWPLAYIDLRPFWYAGGLVVLVPSAGFIAWAFTRRRRWLRAVFWTAVAWTFAFWLPMTLLVDNRRRVGFEMSWRIDATDQGDVAVLTYLKAPECYEVFASQDLVDWLRKRRPVVVGLTIETRSDFGRLRTYTIEDVGVFNHTVTLAARPGNPPWRLLRSL